ncbi:LytR/AlgR family response regulator transcription factor [Tenacibaculum agarivorans]|uniref:LytR/AlgR family response regulator transcription factor n=1 Tax=Tenacibaculum agarivorans TaxID=1908389 RepID=UPI00094BBB0F|nr:LytTR family DNA-binding domain-containing protein [Tenacibaculum agarivorans]
MITCIIIEDELPAQNILKNFVGKIPDITITATFQTAEEASLYLKTNSVDFVFLDINLPDYMGLDFIKTVLNPPLIIITTAYPNYALDSFELETIVDYLVKPFSFDRFLKAIHKIKKSTNSVEKQPPKSIVLNIDKTLHKLSIEDILYIESDRNYITFVTIGKKLVIIDTLKRWKENLSDAFFHVHKSYIVNMHHIEKVSGNVIYIRDKKIPIGRVFKADFFKKFDTK